MIGIFRLSPMSFQLPHAGSLSDLPGAGSVLFLDLEEFSVLPEFLGIQNTEESRTILDLLYLLEGENRVRQILRAMSASIWGLIIFCPSRIRRRWESDSAGAVAEAVCSGAGSRL